MLLMSVTQDSWGWHCCESMLVLCWDYVTCRPFNVGEMKAKNGKKKEKNTMGWLLL